jgi:hypothetical protein
VGFILTMGNAPETAKRWHGAGEIFLWVIYLFWAVWVFNAFLPPRPELTPFENYLGSQLGRRSSSHASGQAWTSEAKDMSERKAAGAGGE